MTSTNTSIEAIFEQAKTGNLTLDQNALGQEGYTFWSALSGSQAMVLTNTKLIRNTNQQVYLSGSTTFLGSNISIQVCIFDLSSSAATQPDQRFVFFKIEMQADTYMQDYQAQGNDGSIDDAAETMIGFYVPPIIFSQPIMIFSSLDYTENFNDTYPPEFQAIVPATQIRAGLNFPLTSTFDNDFSQYTQELFQSNFNLQGDCGLITLLQTALPSLSDQKPYFFINHIFNVSLPLTPPGSPPLQMSLERFAMGFPVVDEGEIWPQVLIEGSVSMDGKALYIEADYDLYHSFLTLTFRDFPSLKTLLNTFCDSPGDFFPSPFDALLDIQLSDLEIVFDVYGKRVIEINLRLTTDQDIELISGILSITPTLDLQIQFPFDEDARALQGTISGVWILGNTQFYTSLTYPSYDLDVSMVDGQTLDVTALADKVFGGVSLPEVTIVGMKVVGNLTYDYYLFNLDISSNLTIPLPDNSTIEIQQLQIAVEYSNQQRNFSINGILNLADVDICISAFYDGQGWQFEGRAGYDNGIAIGTLTEKFGPSDEIPEEIEKLALSNLDITYNTYSRDFTFTGEVKFSSDGQPLNLFLSIKMTHQPDNSYTRQLNGKVIMQSIEIDILGEIQKKGSATEMIFSGTTTWDEPFQLSALVDNILADNGFGMQLPQSLSGLVLSKLDIELIITHSSDLSKSLLVFNAILNQGDKSSIGLFLAHFTPISDPPTPGITLFGADLNVHDTVDMSTLPVVGEFLSEAKFRFDALRMVYASSSIQSGDLDTVNNILAFINVAPLGTAHSTNANASSTPAPFPKGFNLQGSLILGDNADVIPLYASLGSGNATPASQPNTDPKTSTTAGGPATSAAPQLNTTSASAASTPSPVGKSFGPVTIKSVSLGLSGGKASFTFSGSLLLGPVGLELIGFEITSPVDKFVPELSLDGMGLSVNRPPLILDGLFMKDPPDSTIEFGYSGALTIGYNDYLLAAMGSYDKLNGGTTSVFFYGFLGVPIAGLPVILSISGVALGFGYNRSIIMPAPGNIDNFPLIQPVLPQSAAIDFSAMKQDFPPLAGSYWLVIGLRAESFKMIESFVLLSVQFGYQLEVDILGRAQMQFPVPEDGPSAAPPLSRVIVGLVARILPDQGVLDIRGQFLPGTYIYSPFAHITGGFALLSLFKDQNDGQWNGGKEGDFVFTLGGYGPLYTPKSYYPQVPRVEMLWQVSSNLSVRSDAYFAITPEAMMLGGQITADFSSEISHISLNVHFVMGADFVIYWKPYHYLGDMHAALQVAARIHFIIHKTVEFDLSADLSIWGPPFSGHASVHVHVLVSFSVGIDFGQPQQQLTPINWDTFKGSFLPAPEKILSANISNGLITNQSGSLSQPASTQIVNAKELKVTLGTAIPFKTLSGVSTQMPQSDIFGIKPMGLTSDDISSSELQISIVKDGSPLDDLSGFVITPITKNMPAALWQPAATSGSIPKNDGKDLLEGLLTVSISPKDAGAISLTNPPLQTSDPTSPPSQTSDDIQMPASSGWNSFSYNTDLFSTSQG